LFPLSHALSLALGAIVLGPGCAHTVRIDTTPPGATVFVDGALLGTSPVDLEERSGLSRRYEVRLSKPGYEELVGHFEQSEWEARIARPALFLLWFPPSWPAWLFSRRSRRRHHWTLRRSPGDSTSAPQPPEDYPSKGDNAPAPTDYPDSGPPLDYPTGEGDG